MNLNNNISKFCLVILAGFLGLLSCQKMSRPALPSDYPKDNSNLPTGPLRFYLPFDSTSTDAKQLNIRFRDSISNYPSFFPDGSTTYTAGVSGTAYQGSYGTYLHYYTSNDFSKSTNFSMAFWFKATLDQKDHTNADGIMAVSSTKNSWGNMTVYADHETSTSDSMIFKIHFLNKADTPNNDQWTYASYAGAKRLPHGYDGNWHHIAFTYDPGPQTGTLYYDGVQFDQKTGVPIVMDGSTSQFVVAGFQEAVGILDSYSNPNNSWMKGWPGALDNIRLYNTTLSPTDVQALYTNKQ